MSMRTEFDDAVEKARHFHKVNLFSTELREIFDELKDLYETALTHTIPRSEALEKDKVREWVNKWRATIGGDTMVDHALKDLLDMVGEKQ